MASQLEERTRTMIKFNKIEKVVWVLASGNGCVLAHGNPNPGLPPYHLDAMTDHVPALVTAPNKITLRDARRQWNDAVRRDCLGMSGPGRRLAHIRNLVCERRVRITIEEA